MVFRQGRRSVRSPGLQLLTIIGTSLGFSFRWLLFRGLDFGLVDLLNFFDEIGFMCLSIGLFLFIHIGTSVGVIGGAALGAILGRDSVDYPMGELETKHVPSYSGIWEPTAGTHRVR